MDVTLTETQQAAIEATRAALASVPRADVGPADVGPADAGTGEVAAGPLWQALQRAALLGLAAPIAIGGDGLGVGEVMAVLTELGRAGMIGPALAGLATGVLPVCRWGSPEQQRRLLAPALDAGALLTAALGEPSAPIGSTARPAPPQTVMSVDQAVTGVKVGVGYARESYRILVPVSLPGAGGRAAIAIVDPAGPGVRTERAPSSSGAPEYTVHLDRAPAEDLLGGPGAEEALADLYRLALAGACAVADGLVQGALGLTTAHVRTREQFGRPLAAFQAVTQQIADVYLASRCLHLAARAAVRRLAERPPGRQVDPRPGSAPDSRPDPQLDALDRDLAVAAYWAARYGPVALRTCHHLHGGLGLDTSYPLHRYSARLKDLVRLTGGQERCLERLADLTGADLTGADQTGGVGAAEDGPGALGIAVEAPSRVELLDPATAGLGD